MQARERSELAEVAQRLGHLLNQSVGYVEFTDPRATEFPDSVLDDLFEEYNEIIYHYLPDGGVEFRCYYTVEQRRADEGRARGTVMTLIARMLGDANRNVHYVDAAQGLPTNEQLHCLYDWLISAAVHEDDKALKLAVELLREARNHWAGTERRTCELTDLSPHIARIVYALDYALMFASIAYHRLTDRPMSYTQKLWMRVKRKAAYLPG